MDINIHLHHQGCWRKPGHHACAVDYALSLERRIVNEIRIEREACAAIIDEAAKEYESAEHHPGMLGSPARHRLAFARKVRDAIRARSKADQ